MRKTILDIPIDWISPEEAIRKITSFILNKKPHHITTVNPEFIVESRTNAEFKAVLQASDLSLADGIGIVLAQQFQDRITSKSQLVRFGRFLGLVMEQLFASNSQPYRRITGVDLAEKIISQAALSGWKVFLLGGQPGIAQQAAHIWQTRYPPLEIVGTSWANPNDPDVVGLIIETKPDILLVAYGAPKQELFISTYKKMLDIPVMLGVGGTFDTLVGKKLNPPNLIKRLGLEWFAYLVFYPARWRRIWRATIVFTWHLVRN